MTFYFDMDGTIADLYGVDGWLDMLRAENALPYEIAEPLVDCERLIKAIAYLKAEGYKFGIISWTSKGGSDEYNRLVRKAKREWLKKYFPNCFDEIHIVKYGTPKYKVAKEYGYLFDDEIGNRESWTRGNALDETMIFDILEW